MFAQRWLWIGGLSVAMTGMALATAAPLPSFERASVRMDASGRVAPTHATFAPANGPRGSAAAWVFLGPSGADVADVAVASDDPAVILAGVAPNGSFGGTLFRSTDSAASWSEVAAFSGISVHRLAFGSDGAAYAASQSRVWKSTNDGASWTQLAFGFSDPNDETFAVSVDPTDPLVVWAGITSALGGQPINVMRSADGGATWVDRTPPHTPMTCTSIAIDPIDPDTIVAAFRGDFGGGEVWVTTDAGETWEDRSAGLPGNPLNAVVFDGTRVLLGGGQNFGSQDVGLYASDDLGVTWTPLHDDSWPSLVVTDIAVDAADAQTILVSTDGAGINRSSDGGVTWELSVSGSSALAAQSVVFGPSAEVYVGASSLGVYKSIDAGETFAQSSIGLSLIGLYSIASNPADADEIAVAFQGQNNGGVFRSTDGGVNWTLEALPPTRYSKVGFGPDGVLYAISSGPTSIAPEGLYRRASDGTWSGLGPDQGEFFESNLDTMRFSANDPELILLGGADFGVAGFGSTVWRSPDAGISWTKVFLGDDNDMVGDIEINEDGTDQKMVASYDGFTDGQQGGAIRSTDGGNTWIPALQGLPDFARFGRLCEMRSATPAIFLSVWRSFSAGAVYRSDDAGATWTPTGWTGPAIADIACDPLDDQVLYLADGSAARVVRSVDQGVTFTPFGAGLESSTTPTELTAVGDEGATRLFLSTLAGAFATQAAAGDVIFADGFDG